MGIILTENELKKTRHELADLINSTLNVIGVIMLEYEVGSSYRTELNAAIKMWSWSADQLFSHLLGAYDDEIGRTQKVKDLVEKIKAEDTNITATVTSNIIIVIDACNEVITRIKGELMPAALAEGYDSSYSDLQGNVNETKSNVQATQDDIDSVIGISSEENAAIDAEIESANNNVAVLDMKIAAETDPAAIAEFEAEKAAIELAKPTPLATSGFAAKVTSSIGIDLGGIGKEINGALGGFKAGEKIVNGLIGDAVKGADKLLGPISGAVGMVSGLLGGKKDGACAGLDLGSIGDTLGGLFGGAKKLLSGGIGGLTSGLSKAAGGIGSALKSVGKNLMDPIGSLKKAGGLISKGFSGASSLIGKGLKGAKGLLSSGFGKLKSAVSNFDPAAALGGMMKGIGGMLKKIPSMIGSCGVAKARCTSSNLTGLLSKVNGVKFPKLPSLCGKELGGALGGIAKGSKGLNGFLNKIEGKLNKGISGMASGILGKFGSKGGIAGVLRGAADDMIGSVVGDATSEINSLFSGLNSGDVTGLLGGVSQTEPLTKAELAELAETQNGETHRSARDMFWDTEDALEGEEAGTLLDKMSDEDLSTEDRAIYARELKAELEGDSKYYKNTLGDDEYKKLVSNNSAMLDDIAAPLRKPSMFDGLTSFFNPGPNTVSTNNSLSGNNTIAKFDRNDVGGMARAQAEIASNLTNMTIPPKADIKEKLTKTAFSIDNLFDFFTSKGKTTEAKNAQRKRENPSPVTLKVETDGNGNSILSQHVKDRIAFQKQLKVKEEALAAELKAAAPEFPKSIGTFVNNIPYITDSNYIAHEIPKGNGQPNIKGQPIGADPGDILDDVIYESSVQSSNIVLDGDTIPMEVFIKREESKNPETIDENNWETKIRNKYNEWLEMRKDLPGTYPPIESYGIIMSNSPSDREKLDAKEYLAAAIEAHSSFLTFDEAAVNYSTIYTESSYNDMENIVETGNTYKQSFNAYSEDLRQLAKKVTN
jgi:hypothetical protein